MKTLIESLLNNAFAEDIGDGDHSTSLHPCNKYGKARLIIKGRCSCRCGNASIPQVRLEIKMEVFIQDGAEVNRET